MAENVASMDKGECVKITEELQVFPYWLNCSDAVPMNRPRLCWTSEEMEECMDGLQFKEMEFWTKVTAEAEYPLTEQWISEGAVWPGEEQGAVFPTAMKAIPRRQPPEKPAGLNRWRQDTIDRWQADQFRFPPYHYLPQYVIWREQKWRLTNSSEREVLLWPWTHQGLHERVRHQKVKGEL